jgi:hypothetical protein
MNKTTDRDASTRARLEQHWKASDRGDIDTEHAIYGAWTAVQSRSLSQSRASMAAGPA